MITRKYGFSLILSGGAFVSLMCITAFISRFHSEADVGPFLVFYSTIYLLGLLTSLGAYARAPYLVVHNLDLQGQMRSRLVVSWALWSVLVSCVIVVSVLSFLALRILWTIYIVGAILVGEQFIITSLANGLGRFLIARINFVLAPNAVFVLLVWLPSNDLAVAYCGAMSICIGAILLWLGHLGWRSVEFRVAESDAEDPVLFDVYSFLVTVMISSISQLDLWIVWAFSSPSFLLAYAFATRFITLITFPVIAYTNSIQSELALLVANGRTAEVWHLFDAGYQKVRILVVIVSASAPFVVGALSFLVFGRLIPSVFLVSIAVAVGYMAAGLVAPYEMLSYARGHEGRFFSAVLLIICGQVIVSVLLVSSGEAYLVPLVGGAVLFLVRYFVGVHERRTF